MTRQAIGRQWIVAIYPATFPVTLGWPQGPLPLSLGSLRADAATRATYYPLRTVRLLYGEPDRPRRWYKETKVQADTATVIALETLRLDDQSGLVLVHMRTDDILATARALAGRAGGALSGFDIRQLAPELNIPTVSPYTLAFVTPGRRLPRLYNSPRYLRWSAVDQWLWALASRTSQDDYPPDLIEIGRHDQHFLRLSADWSAMILRDGMALVGTRPDRGTSDPFYNHATLYARSIYIDALLIGLLQLHGITNIEEAVASASVTLTDPAMAGLERHVTYFRHRLWWQHLSAHGVPNQILGAFHRQHRLPERFEQILAEISDFNRLARDDEARNINNSAVLFTVITVPVGIGLALLQAMGHADSHVFIVVIAACLGFSLLMLMTRPGRLCIRTVRRHFTS
jgi:hypothetical protein